MAKTRALKKRASVNPGFNLERALIAVEAGVTDKPILSYLDYFMRLEPIENLFFLHVVPVEGVWSGLKPGLLKEKSLQPETISDLRERILSQISLDDTIHVDFQVRTGSPLEELLAEAKQFTPDLILTGLSTKRSSHGILAKAVVRHAPCSTMVIPDLAEPHLSHTMVPVDFSIYSAGALQMAAVLNERLTLPGKITCVHVYRAPDERWFMDSTDGPEVIEKHEDKLRKELLQFVRKHIPSYCYDIELLIIPQTTESIGTYLMDAVQEFDADFIVIGAKGHSHVKELQIGSVTEKILALTSRVPVLVVK